jgi:hypothetical protein
VLQRGNPMRTFVTVSASWLSGRWALAAWVLAGGAACVAPIQQPPPATDLPSVTPDAGAPQVADLQAALDDLCRAPDGPVDPNAIGDNLAVAPVGRWWLCDAVGVFQDARAVELAADGHWYGLFIDGTGQLLRAAGNGVEGTWAAAIGSTSPGVTHPDSISYTVVGRGTETWYVYPTFLDSPRKMTFDVRGRTTYVSADPFYRPL